MTLEMVVGIVFVCTTLFVMGVYLSFRSLFSPAESAVKRRVESLDSRFRATEYSKQALAFVREHEDKRSYAIFSDFPPLLNLPLLFSQAGVNIDVMQWLIFVFGSATVVGFLVWFLTQNLVYALGGFAAALSIPYLHILYKRKKRIAAFEAYLPQCLELISRSLKAGHPFAVGLQMVSTELPPPVGTEFGRVFAEQQMGLPLEDSLREMAARVALLDLRFFVLSILIHRQTGGDLAEVLDNLAGVIRDRLKVQGQVRALTAEGRLSGWVLCLLPFFVFFVIKLTNPTYMDPLLYTAIGRKLLYIALGMQLLGVLVIRKIINIKV